MKKYIFKLLICVVVFAGIGHVAYAADANVECEKGTLYINGKIELGECEHPVNVTVTGYDSDNNLNYIDIITAGTDGVAQFRYKNLGKSGNYTYVFDADTVNVTETVQLSGFIGNDYWDVFVEGMKTLAAGNNADLLGEKLLSEKDNLSLDMSGYDGLEDKTAVFNIMLKDYTSYASVDEIVKAFERAVVLCNFNENKSIDTFMSIYNEGAEKDYFGIADKLPKGTKGTIFDDLSNDMQNSILSEYVTEEFEKSSDIAEKLTSLILFDTIKNADHFGIVKNVITAYNASGYISVTIDGFMDSVCKKLMGTDVKSFADAESRFENCRSSLIGPLVIPTTGGGGGGGGRGGSSPSLIINSEAIPLQPSENTLQKIETNTGLHKGQMYFTDMEDAKWGLAAVNNLYEKKIINGVGDDKFEPHRNVSRAEMSKLISSVAGFDAGTEVPFVDVDKNQWYYPYVCAVYEKSVFVGRLENIFGVNDGITRQEAAVAIYRLISPYITADSEQNAVSDEEEDLGNIFETGNDEVVEDVFADHADIAPWAVQAVYALKNANAMTGRTGNTFAPNDTLTRVEAAVLCNTICKYFEEGNA